MTYSCYRITIEKVCDVTKSWRLVTNTDYSSALFSFSGGGLRVSLGKIELVDISCYLKWLSDPEVNKYLEARHQKYSKSTLTQWIYASQNSKDSEIFSLIDDLNETPIGTLRISRINLRYKTCDLGLMIGDKNYWGKGYGTESIKKACTYLKDSGFRKVHAGAYSANIGSIKSFLKNDFFTEGRYVGEVIDDSTGMLDDILLMSKFL
jgi:ribosomal-protein-alanine N-acetyltransferase